MVLEHWRGISITLVIVLIAAGKLYQLYRSGSRTPQTDQTPTHAQHNNPEPPHN